MAETNIKEGDDVSWKWGNGKPTGTVSEVATEGSLTLETAKGNTVKRNASEDNPTVHISHERNDVLKRASELTKLSEDGKEDESMGEASGDEKKEPEVGEKRARSEIDEAEGGASGEESLEKEAGKEVKKPKVAESENVGTKDGGVEEGQDKEDAELHQESDDAGKGGQNEEAPAPKKRGPGRPKKGETRAEKATPQEVSNGDSIGKRTRSRT